MGGYSSDVWFISCITLNFATIVCYIIVGILVKYKTNIYNPTRKLFKAIVFIMITIFFGWTVNAVFRICIPYFNLSQRLAYILSIYFGSFVNIACAANYFILLKFSYDYQIVFIKYLNYIFRMFSKKVIFNMTEGSIGPTFVQHRRTTFTIT